MTEESWREEIDELRARVERLEAELELGRNSAAPAASVPPLRRESAEEERREDTATSPDVAPLPERAATTAAGPSDLSLPASPGGASGGGLNPVVIIAAVGAAVFLAGAAFLLRFAIEKGWVGPTARFSFGIVVGLALGLLAARYLLRGARGLGTSLLAAGLGTLEFTLYVGAFRYAFYGAGTGFALSAAVCVGAGALAVRARFQEAFVVTYLVAFLSPFVFSTGVFHPIALSAFELVLFLAALGVAQLAPEVRRWTVSRWLVGGTQAAIQLAVGIGAAGAKEPEILLLLVAFLAFAAVWSWRPVEKKVPASSPTLLWLFLSIAALGACAWQWNALGASRHSFVLPVLLLAAIQLGLVPAVRKGLGGEGGEAGLIVVAAALVAAAVPIGLEWSWAGPVWGLFAVALLWGSIWLEKRGPETHFEANGLAVAGVLIGLAATIRWVAMVALGKSAFGGGATPFFNAAFATALFAALAAAFLARSRRAEVSLGFVWLELLANIAVALEVAAAAGRLGASDHGQLVAITLVWALSGALQWLAGLRRQAGILRIGLLNAGYAAIGMAVIKLTFVDLAQESLALRALVFLVAGGIFLASALVAHRLSARAPVSLDHGGGSG